ncbi:hypothetical protein BV22DRAFT_329729 [Leucogyrophana mollusca]|uniref:Uncharacterized protein n=1 Tax=Leucogyrophana mollusca TaxID=85980 RepID=A0ACB8BMG6_9AGAM|nr:hypothetical protein BV22DRAFT_329729 [Leucogyrophana mollusca]
MDNGQQNEYRGLNLYRPPTIVNAEEYARNRAHINHYKKILEQYEKQNNDAYGRFFTQELEERVRAGQEAEYWHSTIMHQMLFLVPLMGHRR